METAKEQVQKILEVLPDTASLEDIQYHIYVRQKVEQGSRRRSCRPGHQPRRGDAQA
jgi:hypothetical protein